MAEGQTLTELAVIKLNAGICGVIFLIISVQLVACGLAAFILHDLTFQFSMFSIGLIIAGFGISFWALYSGVCYLTLSYKGNGNEKQLYLRMVGYMIQWALFAFVVHVGAIIILGVALNAKLDIDIRLRVITITSMVGCGVSGVFTFLGYLNLSKCIPKLGLKREPPSKRYVLAGFKSHGCVLPIISLHQLVWALVAILVPGFGGGKGTARIAAFIVGGFAVPLLAIVTAALCFKIVHHANNPNENIRVMTITLINLHKAWVWAFVGVNFVGTGLYTASFDDLQNEYDNWVVKAPIHVVTGHVLSLMGNALIGYIFVAVAHYEKFTQVLGLCATVKPKTTSANTNNTANDNGSGVATAKKTQNKPAAKPAAAKKPHNKPNTSGATGTPTCATGTSPGAIATSTGVAGTSTGATGTSTGATGTTSGGADLIEMKERNRLLQEQISLQKQLIELRQLHPNEHLLYSGNNVTIGPGVPPGLPPVYTAETRDSAPPCYEDVTAYSEKSQ